MTVSRAVKAVEDGLHGDDVEILCLPSEVALIISALVNYAIWAFKGHLKTNKC